MDAQLNITGKDVNKRFNNEMTALHIAAELHLLEAAKWLINKGADLEAKEIVGWTPLHHAATVDAIDVARLLIDRGAKVDAKEKDGLTPLHYAAYGNSLQVARLLIDNGADKNTKISSPPSSEGKKPIEIARKRGHSEMIRLLQ